MSLFQKIISLQNLLVAWQEFKRGKTAKQDVAFFNFYIEDNLFNLHNELKSNQYTPGKYESFYVTDPKIRYINKASVKDRIVHQAIFRILYPIFDKNFIANSYSCRIGKGTHKGVLKLEEFARKASNNHKEKIYYLKCDIKKFFKNIDHEILLKLLTKKVEDEGTTWLINKIIKSYESEPNKSLPLGNVTSQLFANIYLNELDQFVKHKLKQRYYIRYCDDIVILNKNKGELVALVDFINNFLNRQLKLSLHEDKTIIKKLKQGVDFLGYVILPNYRVLRTRTKHRMLKNVKLKKLCFEEKIINKDSYNSTIQSYMGILKHCEGYKLSKEIKNIIDM